MASRLDPLISRAARWLDVLRPGRFARAAATGRPAHQTAAPPASETRSARELAESVADRLQAETLPEYAWLDVGVWGRPVYRSAAEIALRLRAVSVTGDELG